MDKQTERVVAVAAVLMTAILLVGGGLMAALEPDHRAEGRQAFQDGVSDSGNPYRGTGAARAWLEGWVEGKKASR